MAKVVMVGVLTLCLAAGAALAARKPAPPVNPAVVQSLLDCRKLADDAQRLACFDRASAAVEQATASGDLVSIDREQRKAARRQAFGFTLPSLSFLERGEKSGELNHIVAQARSAFRDGDGKWVVQLDDGSVWRQTEVQDLGREPHAGSKVEIGRGMLGSFFMTIDGQGAGKAKRES